MRKSPPRQLKPIITSTKRTESIRLLLEVTVKKTVLNCDKDYAFFYRDLTENLENYVGKTVKFRGIVARDKRLETTDVVVSLNSV